jgi:hypothetical protein
MSVIATPITPPIITPGGSLVQDLFIAAMEVIGATSLDEAPEASELQKCLRHCNLMLNSWSGRSLMLAATLQESFPLVANQRIYTIGVGGNFNTAKPLAIESAFLRDSSLVDSPIYVVELDIYDSFDDKMISTGKPDAIYYTAGMTQQASQLGQIFVYAIPDQVYTLFLNSQKYLTSFANLTDNVTFQPVYYDAIVQNLAVKIWTPMGRKGPVPSHILKAARDTMQVVETINHTLPVARIDIPGVGMQVNNNILSGDWMT